MSRNTHCQALLQRNKHNEQQSHIHVILRNLGNQPGKTPMWGNPKREREILLASGKIYQQQDYIYSQEKTTYSTQTVPPKICLEKRAKSVLLYGPPRKTTPRKSCQSVVVRLFCTAALQQQISSSCLDFVPSLPRKTMPTSLLYGLYGSVQYGLPHSNKFQHTQNRVLPWEMCPSSLGKCTQLAALSSLKLSRNLSISSSHCCVLHTTQCILL
jgi:hypothetical protein